jgi:CRP-like cAMP-binding protein
MASHVSNVARSTATASAYLAAAGRRATLKRGDIVSSDDGVVILGDLALSVRRDGKPSFDLGFLGPGCVLGVEHIFVDYPPVVGRAMRDGFVWHVSHDALMRAINEREDVKAALMQIAVSSSANHFRRAADAIEMRADRRVAQWVLECARALETDELDITHHEIANALGVRRSSVTDGLHLIEADRVIRSHRRRLLIRDAVGLARYAGLDGDVPPVSRAGGGPRGGAGLS